MSCLFVAQALSGKMEEVEERLSNLVKLSDSVATRTSAAGCESMKREISVLVKEKETIASELLEAENHLRLAAKNWKEFEEVHSTLQQSMEAMEGEIRDIVPVATLEEKQEQVLKLKVGLYSIGAMNIDEYIFPNLKSAY